MQQEFQLLARFIFTIVWAMSLCLYAFGEESSKLLVSRPKLELQVGHSGMVSSIAYSPNGKILASASWDRSIKLWNAQTGVLLRTINEQDNWMTRDLAFSPDGSTLAGAGAIMSINPINGQLQSQNSSGILRCWEVKSGRLQRELSTQSEGYEAFPGSRFKPETLSALHQVDTGSYGVAFSPNGKLVYVSIDSGIRIYDVASGEMTHIIRERGIDTIVVSPDGRYIAGSNDSSVFVWNVGSGKLARRIKGDFASSNCLCYSLDGKLLACARKDNSIQVWDTRTGKSAALFKEQNRIIALTFSSQGHSLISSTFTSAPSNDNRVLSHSALTIWNHASGQRTVIENDRPVIWSLAVTPDGKQVATGDFNGEIRVVNIPSGSLSLILKNVSSAIHSLIFLENGAHLVTLADDPLSQGSPVALRQWNTLTGAMELEHVGKREHTLNDLPPKLQPFALVVRQAKGLLDYARNGKWVAGVDGGDEKMVRVFTPDTNSNLSFDLLHPAKVNSVAFSADGKLLATTCDDERVRVWDVENHTLIKTLVVSSSTYRALFLLNGSILVSGSEDAIRYWDTVTGNLLQKTSSEGAINLG